MKCISKTFFLALVASFAILYPNSGKGYTEAELQEQKSADQEQEPEYSEDEFTAWENATKEPDLLKRGTMLIEFIQKYPKSKLMSYIDSAYNSLLFECSDNKKFRELEISPIDGCL